jgi:hypothetical protein
LTINAPLRPSEETVSSGAAFIQSESDCYASECERFGSETGCYGRPTKRSEFNSCSYTLGYFFQSTVDSAANTPGADQQRRLLYVLEIILPKIKLVTKGLQFALDHFVSSSLDTRVVNLLPRTGREYTFMSAESLLSRLNFFSGLSRPSGHHVGMETPLTFGEIDSFAGDDDKDGLTGGTKPVSVAAGSTGSSNVGPQGEENAAIAEVEDLVIIPEIVMALRMHLLAMMSLSLMMISFLPPEILVWNLLSNS